MNDDRTPDEEHWDAERVRTLRAWLDATQATLADRLGTRQQTVSEWETGASQPRRMSRRLLHLVAEDSGFYSVDRRSGADPPSEPPTGPPDRPPTEQGAAPPVRERSDE